jgi:folate-binding protein YgfZ
MSTNNLLDDYRRLTQSSGFVVLVDRTTIRIKGKDRLAFLHNFCTADVKSLVPGKSTEAFILNSKGKVFSHVYLMSGDDQLLINTTGGQFDAIHDHLETYIIREDVGLNDASQTLATIFVAGPEAAAKLRCACENVPSSNEFARTRIGSVEAGIAQVDLAGIGFLLTVPADDIHQVKQKLSAAGIAECSVESFHALRIEHKTPWFGIDASDANLPQELGRDEQAICFTKGCYLGQETVARLDALGHVNQHLVGLILDREAAPGTELLFEEKPVGRLTSVAWSPASERWIALGYLKAKWSAAGCVAEFDGGHATVV